TCPKRGFEPPAGLLRRTCRKSGGGLAYLGRRSSDAIRLLGIRTVMMTYMRRAGRIGLWSFAALALAAATGATIALLIPRRREAPSQAPLAPAASLRLVPGSTDTLELSPDLVSTLGIRMVQAQLAGRHDRLSLSGSLFLDPNRMVPVHSRFAGEVVSIGNNVSGVTGP